MLMRKFIVMQSSLLDMTCNNSPGKLRSDAATAAAASVADAEVSAIMGNPLSSARTRMLRGLLRSRAIRRGWRSTRRRRWTRSVLRRQRARPSIGRAHLWARHGRMPAAQARRTTDTTAEVREPVAVARASHENSPSHSTADTSISGGSAGQLSQGPARIKGRPRRTRIKSRVQSGATRPASLGLEAQVARRPG